MRQALSPDPVVFDDSRQACVNIEGTTLLATLETLSQAVQDLQKRAEAQEKEIRDEKKSLENTKKWPREHIEQCGG
jgi:hypothetical protein